MICDTGKFEWHMQMNMHDTESLAKEVQVSRQTISDIKLGKRTPRAKTLRKICVALKCEPLDLLKER